MKYMLLIHDSEKSWGSLSDDEQKRIMAGYRRFTEEIRASGHYCAGSQLAPTSMATSVRVRNGKRLVTDGPFAETREHLGGYFLIEANDLDEALAVAGRIPGARKGTVEVRPVIELAGLP